MRAYIRTKPDLEALKVLQKGLIPWIEDKLSRIGDVDYNEHVSIVTQIHLPINLC